MLPAEPCARPPDASRVGDSSVGAASDAARCRPVVYAHLLGVGAFWLASYQDRHPKSLNLEIVYLAGFWGLATFLLCPILAMTLLFRERLSRRDAVALLVLTLLSEALQVFALVPAVQ